MFTTVRFACADLWTLYAVPTTLPAKKAKLSPLKQGDVAQSIALESPLHAALS
jgi:hypothetical protein